MSQMSAAGKSLLLALVVGLAFLAGCSDSPAKKDDGQQLAEEAPEVEVTDTTGGIRGVVVDEAIRPVKGAKIQATGVQVASAESDDNGLFAISGLKEGTYILKASHPLFNEVQQSAEVVAGVKEPPAVKIQLARQVFAQPYYETLQYDGFIVCSVNTQGVLSEECGEGVGVDCIMPPIPCGRVGGQSGNNVQFDVAITNEGLASIVFEKVWTPTSEAGNELYTPIGTNWVCNPGCSWDEVTEMKGPSPQYAYASGELLEDSEVTVGVNVTMFTWAGSFEDPAGVAVNQKYQDFMTLFYYLPAPEGWSFVQGSPSPY